MPGAQGSLLQGGWRMERAMSLWLAGHQDRDTRFRHHSCVRTSLRPPAVEGRRPSK
jgi:hypothetical protein